MDRTDALLARASQYLKAGTARPLQTAQGPSSGNITENENRQNAKSKAAEDEVEAYLLSLTGGGGEKAQVIKGGASLPLPVASVPLSGRGRAFLKTKESTHPQTLQNQPPRNEVIEVPLHKYSSKEPVRSHSVSSSSFSSPSPPISPVRRQVRPIVEHQSSKEADEVDDDEEAAIDRRLVAEHFRLALKTSSGSMRNSVEQLPKQKSVTKKESLPEPAALLPAKRAPPLASTHDSAPIISSSFVDESGNVIYSLTFEEDDEEGKNQMTDEDEKSYHEVDEEEEYDDESPMFNVVQSVEELLGGAAVSEPEPVKKIDSRPETANSLDSVAESIASRPVSAASTESVQSQRYSDDFEESSRSRSAELSQPKAVSPTKTEKPAEKNFLTAPPVLNLLSARSTEAHSVTTTQIVEESVAVPLTESLTTDREDSGAGVRQRAKSYGATQSLLKLPLGKTKTADTFIRFNDEPTPEAPRRSSEAKSYKSGGGKDAGIQTAGISFPTGMEQNMPFPQQFFGGSVPPVVVMMPPQSFFQQYFSAQPQIPPTSAPSEARHLFNQQQEVPHPRKQQHQQQKPPVIAQPSIYLPFFLERSQIRTLVAQCRMLTESINATRIAYERRLANIQLKKQGTLN